MGLTLSITAAPVGRELTSRDIDGVCSIGRDPNISDWVLPDRTREVSGRHCVLAPTGDRWTVTDHSLNGTFLNNEPTRIGPGGTRNLRDGDQLRIGDYVIEVRHRHDAAAAPATNWWDDAAPRAKPAPGTEASEPTIKTGPQPPLAEPGLQDDSYFNPLPLVDIVSTAKPPWTPPPPIADPDDERDAAPPAGEAGRIGLGESDAADVETLVQPPPRSCPSHPAVDVAPADATTAAGPQAARPDAAALAAFLRGAGLSDVTLADPAATMESLGAAFRACVSGLRSTLDSRNSIRRGFHIDETRMQARGNNPLKFQDSDDAALKALLGVGGAPDIAPATAIARSLRDIRLHELALMGAMQEAVQALVETLAPAPAQTQAAGESRRLNIAIPVLQKARAFDAYLALHARTVQTLDDNFDSVFGRAFARAYERILLDGKSLEGMESKR